ncbi:MAG: hypothetical protein HFI31_01620 [Lachnospiraceae bacterium]|jgi:peroxiredoxin family protein|nr:hypothetical protein [Lachnospiraceae bacterium]MCI8994300.1 hypothetical protein [Lachnospiraceae bacterium]MCI9132875.1 hypothetical protein [Lachnospiraceae bacterium]
MLTGEDFAILNEAYRGARTGQESINTVISKIYDEDLALDLNRQAVRFMAFENRIADKLREENQRPQRASRVERALMWTDMQVNTLTNTSTEHMADLMIQGNARAIMDLMRTVKKNQGAKREYCELAEELMDFEEKNIAKLKSYLRR